VKTTVELSEELFRRAKAEAALRGRRFKDLVEEGLRLVLQAPRGERAHPSLEELMKPARGVVDSGVSDLASNPKHLKGFGRELRRDR
jgi:predicted component of type VI protein secretion system